MNTIINITIDTNFHISQPPTSFIRKLAIFIPPKDKCIPSKEHYFGVDEFNYGAAKIDQENAIFYITPRQFILNSLYNMQYAYELACTHPSLIELPQGDYADNLLQLGRNSAFSKQLVQSYVNSFLSAKSKRKYAKAYHYGTILRRLYSGIREISKTEEEDNIYYSMLSKKMKKDKMELILVHMDFELQDCEKKSDMEALFPTPNIEFINSELIKIYTHYLEGDVTLYGTV